MSKKDQIKTEIQELIQQYDLTIEQIAVRLGVSAMTIYRWKKGMSEPKSRFVWDTLKKFKKELAASKEK